MDAVTVMSVSFFFSPSLFTMGDNLMKSCTSTYDDETIFPPTLLLLVSDYFSQLVTPSQCDDEQTLLSTLFATLFHLQVHKCTRET